MFLACACFLAACSDDFIPEPGPPANDTGEFTTFFYAEFSLYDHSDYAGGCCDNPPFCNLALVGEGFGLPIGLISASFHISCNKSTGTYCDGFGKFVAENGDELYFFVKEGKMLPNTGENCDRYGTCFNDLAEFTGGTGIFREARGFFYTNAFIQDGDHEEWRTDFFSNGTLTTLYLIQNHRAQPPSMEIDEPF